MNGFWQELGKWVVATHLGLIVGSLVMLVLLSGMLRQRRNPAGSAAWLVFMLAIPYLGVPLYLFIGTRKLRRLVTRKRAIFSGRITDDEGLTPLQRLLVALGAPAPNLASEFSVHADATAAQAALFVLLDTAQTSIDVEVFILGDDAIGERFIDQLAACAARGVRVRLLLDGVGSFALRRKHLQRVIEAGGRVTWFVPVLHVPLRGRTNLRNHRKLVVVDGRRVWSGGRNIASEYLQPETESQWVDFSYSLAGPVVADFRAVFEADWEFASGEATSGPESRPEAAEEKRGLHPVQLVPSGPDMLEDVLPNVIGELIAGARERVILVTPYFVPSEMLQQLLCIAARRGTRIDIVLPQRSNHRIADFVRNRFLRELYTAGVHIHVLPKAMLHAKVLCVDLHSALVGSANFDQRSLYLNFELMTLLSAREDVEAVSQWVETLMARTQPWTEGRHGAVRETLEGLLTITTFQL